jgi:hypothetical protein
VGRYANNTVATVATFETMILLELFSTEYFQFQRLVCVDLV